MRKIGDRRDGIRVKNLDGMHVMLPHLKPNRCNSDIYINQKIDVTEMVKYMDKLKKKHSDKKITYFHLFSMAIAKVIYNKPLLNRFIINRKYYDRNSVSLGFVAKVSFDDDAKECFLTVDIPAKTNVFKISYVFNEAVSRVRNNKQNKTDNLIDLVGRLPNFLIKIIMKLFKLLDNYDLLPKSLTVNDIYHSTLIISNLGSINCGSIYHNLTDFGTSSILLTIGTIHKEPVVMENGEIVSRDIVDFGINLDERIADGVYFAKAVQLFEYILQNPKLLEGNADDIIDRPFKK